MKHFFIFKSVIPTFLSGLILLFLAACSEKSNQNEKARLETNSGNFESDSFNIDL